MVWHREWRFHHSEGCRRQWQQLYECGISLLSAMELRWRLHLRLLGDAYKDAGKIPAENEKTMTDFFDKAVNTWSNKGLGIVIGEWGVTDHYKSDSEKVHENMTYYCKFLTTEARKRGFSTFVWDNNHFGNGSEKYGIFDRFKSMKVNAPWILEGIFGKEYC